MLSKFSDSGKTFERLPKTNDTGTRGRSKNEWARSTPDLRRANAIPLGLSHSQYGEAQSTTG